MQNERRKFLKLAGLTGIGAASGSMLEGFAALKDNADKLIPDFLNTAPAMENNEYNEKPLWRVGRFAERE